MKILYVTTISNTINSFLIPHIRLLIEQGHEVDIACNKEMDLEEELIYLGCNIHLIEFQRTPLKKENIISYKKIKKLVIDEAYDLIHTHTPVASFVTRLACRNIENVKILYTAHGFHFYKGAPIKNWILFYLMEKTAAKWTDGIITINNEDFKLSKKFNIRKNGQVFLIPGIGVDTSQFKSLTLEEKKKLRSEFGYKEDDFLLIYAAELNRNKNQEFLIKNVALLKKSYPNIKLLLAGDGELKKVYEKYIDMLNVRDNVNLLGYRSDLAKIVPMCDVGVSASLREGLGINIIEYMSCELPVVASENRGHKEIIKNGENGFLFKMDNSNYFNKLIENLYIDSSLIEKLGANAVDSIDKFSIENSKKVMGEIYSLYTINEDDLYKEKKMIVD
ncbi:glycosyltransferase family 4 protein [Peribacillus sp. NPDC097198]|uniref:glycosyltransferase family 4 protein n=1 Tax=Peribacillus sp. NPDC097198 TaxID=3364397 RepID=UPI00381A3354